MILFIAMMLAVFPVLVSHMAKCLEIPKSENKFQLLSLKLLAIFLINSPNRTEEASMVPLVVSAMDNDDDDCIFGEDEELLQATDELNQSAQSMSSVNLSLSSNSSANFSEDSDNLRPGQVLRTSEFWILWATFLCNTQVYHRIDPVSIIPIYNCS